MGRSYHVKRNILVSTKYPRRFLGHQFRFFLQLFITYLLLDDIGLYREIEMEEDGDTIKKKCLGACETQLYSILVTNTNYPTKATFKHTTQFCTVVKKLMNSCETRNKSLSKFKSIQKLCVTIIELKVLNCCFYNNIWLLT